MQYLGGKYRIARHVESAVLEIRGGRGEYVEPFVGGGATFARCAPHFDVSRAYDVVPDLVLLWRAVRAGWVPPSEVSEADYAALRDAEPSALRAFAGFGCSFGGKWFGGYGRQRIAGGKPARETTLAPGAARSVQRKASAFRSAEPVELRDYREIPVGPRAVVYADPPYAGTTGYGAADPFDSDEFWEVARSWADTGAAVLVSELAAPGGWVPVWSKAGPDYLSGGQKPGARTEQIFTTSELAERHFAVEGAA